MSDLAEPKDRDCREPYRPPRPLAKKGYDSPSGKSVGNLAFSILWRQILQLRKLGMAMGGGRSRVD